MLWAMIIVAAISAQITGFYANSVLNLILFPMTLEFLLGAGAASMIKAGWMQYRWLALGLGLVALVLAYLNVDFQSTDALLPTARTFAYGPAFALLLYAVVAIERTSRFGQLIPQFAVRLGDWSYSLYLCHLLVISAIARVFFAYFGQAGTIDNIIFLLISVVATVVISGLVYHVFERRILSVSKRARSAWFDSPGKVQSPKPISS